MPDHTPAPEREVVLRLDALEAQGDRLELKLDALLDYFGIEEPHAGELLAQATSLVGSLGPWPRVGDEGFAAWAERYEMVADALAVYAQGDAQAMRKAAMRGAGSLDHPRVLLLAAARKAEKDA